eukprot:NODE_1813_length_1292_cov_7.111826_g1501_i0.p1 GENE.NODE_1813_length_1292_cov_7.111826_g1501_i0~~NODE_1813_length_1292_cov_7.111826_g1501_i0.p1  ORF type:complete len:74 (-),score=0.34 NODE_1813_length_1292_cov_7.111826_g1501_i0:1029-1250(-)
MVWVWGAGGLLEVSSRRALRCALLEQGSGTPAPKGCTAGSSCEHPSETGLDPSLTAVSRPERGLQAPFAPVGP